MKGRIINVKGTEVSVATRQEQDYIALTDMVKNFDGGSALIEQWLKSKDTVLFLGQSLSPLPKQRRINFFSASPSEPVM